MTSVRRRAINRIAAIAVAVAGSVALSSAQQARDNTAPPTGTSAISGTISTDETNSRPLRRVTVTITSSDFRVPQSTVTDDTGRFRIANLAPGNYTLSAARPGFVTAYYGGKQPGRGPGTAIAVIDGKNTTGISVRMTRGGVITGMVRSPNGRPATSVQVQVVPKGGASLERLAATAGGFVTTDDRGIYRAFGLVPGEYTVLVRYTQLGQGAELRQMSDAEIAWGEQVTSAASQPGLTASPLPPAPAAGQTVMYAPVYHPGTTDASAAGVVTVGAGEERAGIDVVTELVPTARVTGVLLGADGQPAAGSSISLQAQGISSNDIIGSLMGAGGSRTGADGRFTIAAVAPGRYRLIARGAPPPVAGAPAARQGGMAGDEMAMAMMMNFMPGGAGASPFWAQEDIAVSGRDLEVMLRLQPGMTVTGKIVFESTTQQAPADLTRTRLMFVNLPSSAPTGLAAITMMSSMSFAETAADGTFTAKGLSPNRYRVQVMGPGMMAPGVMAAMPAGGWTLKSAMLGGHDVADVAFDLKPGEDVSGIVVTMTDRTTEVSGTVIDQADRPAPGFPIIVYSTDRTYWTFGSRRIQQARPASDGKYRLVGLPAGEYFVCAVADIDQQDLYTPEFLEQLIPGSFKITLAEGERKTQVLRLGG